MSVAENSTTLTSEPTSEELQVRHDSQLGPGMSGRGSVVIYTEGRPVLILFKPSDERLARVLYNTDSRQPDKPLKPLQELRIDGARNVFLDYRTDAGGDFKLGWKIL
jgi:hypothetical protein